MYFSSSLASETLEQEDVSLQGAPKALRESCTYFQDFSVGIQHVHGHLDVLLHTFATPFKVPLLQGQVQVIPDVTCRDRAEPQP